MMSLLWKGVQLERRYGSPLFACLLGELLLLAHAATVLLAALLAANMPGYWYLYRDHCAVGFSAVLFALKVVLNHDSPGYSQVMGITLPTKYLCWAELLLASYVNPSASFLGHLGGILAGWAHVLAVGPALQRIGAVAGGAGVRAARRPSGARRHFSSGGRLGGGGAGGGGAGGSSGGGGANGSAASASGSGARGNDAATRLGGTAAGRAGEVGRHGVGGGSGGARGPGSGGDAGSGGRDGVGTDPTQPPRQALRGAAGAGSAAADGVEATRVLPGGHEPVPASGSQGTEGVGPAGNTAAQPRALPSVEEMRRRRLERFGGMGARTGEGL